MEQTTPDTTIADVFDRLVTYLDDRDQKLAQRVNAERDALLDVIERHSRDQQVEYTSIGTDLLALYRTIEHLLDDTQRLTARIVALEHADKAKTQRLDGLLRALETLADKVTAWVFKGGHS